MSPCCSDGNESDGTSGIVPGGSTGTVRSSNLADVKREIAEAVLALDQQIDAAKRALAQRFPYGLPSVD